ncbi:phage holin family protein [Labilibacter sediminis]|nr:phage holin family protein [Labilibacter sediminis]
MTDKNESISEEFTSVKKEVESYIQNKIDLTKLHLAEDLSRFVSGFAVKIVLFYIGFFVLMFVSIAGAFAIGSYTDSNELGFVIVAGVYFLLGLISLMLRRSMIQKPIIKAFIHLFFPNYSHYDKK